MTQAMLWTGAGVALSLAVLAVLAGFADRRRRHRVAIDRVGWVDWTSVQMAAIVAALLCGGIALHG